jgi:pimeloyl-ACP methyl ester carboxylesterase
MAWIRLVAAVVLVLAICDAAPAQIPSGKAQQKISLGGLPMDVFTYRPNCANPSLLVVFHGLNRNASGYRNSARPIADKMCMLVMAPLFDKKRFPTARYQRGGIMDGRTVLPSNQWTGTFALKVVDWARQQENARLPYSFIGHSAGAQFLSRVAAFVPSEARRIVIANPSTYVMPNLQVRTPYGFGGMFQSAAAQAALRRYIEAPVTIYLGEDDEDTEDETLATGRNAMAQGANRHERGLNAFKQGMTTAIANKWRFNWRLVELPGVGHSARGMFRSDEAMRALRP